MRSFFLWMQRGAPLLPATFLLLLMIVFSQSPVPFWREALPVLPALSAIYYWALFRPASLPLWLVALAALLHDVLYGLPLGASLFAFLGMLFICDFMRRKLMLEQFILAWICFAPLCLVAIGSVAFWQFWALGLTLPQLASAYFPVILCTWLSYPLFHLLYNWCYYQLQTR